MSKLTDIIRREVEGVVSKQGGLMVTPAVVTAVQEDHLRADVKLLGNGAEIKGMLNKSPGKLTVGQTVTVAYSTLPSSGVILIANGETDPLSEGGGWEVENAVLYDAANLHEYTADTTLMTDISANTKLYYGANNRILVAQGMLCFFGSRTLADDAFTDALDDVLTANAKYICPEYKGIVSYRYDTSNNQITKYEADVRVYPHQIYKNSNDRVTVSFTIRRETTVTNITTGAVTTTTNSATVSTDFLDLSDITDYGLILQSDYFGGGSPHSLLNPYVPYGYIGYSLANGGVYAMLVYKNSNSSVNKWNARYDGVIRGTGSGMSYTSLGIGAVMPITEAETVYALGATQRTEPVPTGGGS